MKSTTVQGYKVYWCERGQNLKLKDLQPLLSLFATLTPQPPCLLSSLFVSLFILLLRYWTLLGWCVRTLIPELKNGPKFTAWDENRKTPRGTDPGRWMRLGVRVGTEVKRGRGDAGEILNSCHEDRNLRKKMFLWVMQSDFSLYQKTWVKNNIAVSASGSWFRSRMDGCTDLEDRVQNDSEVIKLEISGRGWHYRPMRGTREEQVSN